MKTVLALGCFDLLHISHVRHLEKASKLGKLIVAVTSDAFVNKGKGRPLFPQDERAEMLRALRFVTEVIICDTPNDAISKIKPDFYVKGYEYLGKLPEQKIIKSYGGQVVFIDGTIHSSTEIMTGEYFKRKCQ